MKGQTPWISPAPASWTRTNLGNLVDVHGGMTPSKDNVSFWSGTVPWVSPKDMKVFRLRDSEDHISEKAVHETGLKWVPPGSVLMVTRGMILDHTVPIAVTTAKVTLNQDMKALLPRDGVDGDYLAWLLIGLNAALLARVEEAGHGTKALRTEQWRKLPIAVPGVEKQRQIATFLDGKAAVIDALIAKKERLIELLEERSKSLMTTAVTEGLGDTRGQYAEVRLDHIIREVQRPVRVGLDTRYAEIGVRSHGRGIFHKEPITGAMLDEKKVYWIEPGDLVFNIVFAWERAVAVASESERGMIGSHRFPCYRSIGAAADVRYLRYLFVSEFGSYLLDRNSPGAAGRNRTLDRKALMKETIRLPPPAVQRTLADRLDKELGKMDAVIMRTARSLTLLREYRQSLITAAVTGQLPLPAAPAAPASH